MSAINTRSGGLQPSAPTITDDKVIIPPIPSNLSSEDTNRL